MRLSPALTTERVTQAQDRQTFLTLTLRQNMLLVIQNVSVLLALLPGIVL